MLYEKYVSSSLDEKDFRTPTAEYRGAPFWAWNSGLDKKELEEQIELFRKMGFGGFHMHVRQGLEVPYLSPEFMEAIQFCTQKAKEKGMFAWLYDEDRWPSGCAGGFVTKEKKYRQKYLLMTDADRTAIPDQNKKGKEAEGSEKDGANRFLAAFAVYFDESGKMCGYQKIPRDGAAEHKRYFFACTKPGGEPRFNYQAYVDVLSKEAIDQFIAITYEGFRTAVGEEFGKTIPAIFTDEPQTIVPLLPVNNRSGADGQLPWTFDFPETFLESYGVDLIQYLPELFYAMEGDGGKAIRYRYYRHVMERFAESYMDNIGNWCEKNHIMLTGHVIGEDSLEESSSRVGDVMRMYRNMQLPGVDMLLNGVHLVTVKQCQSVVRQFGKVGMMSELYGVTGWDFDFRGHKFQGDWQACLGVTLRVPHLAWQTMKGEGKRDYPASVFYQSPWYEEYKRIEDHFARVNMALTRGKACVRTAVLHPIESYWLLRCSAAESMQERKEMDLHFKELAEWLLTGGIDFDYLAESLLEELCKEEACPLKVGEMAYDTIVVADCTTLRPFTIRLLQRFKERGGRLIFIGKTPRLCMGMVSPEAADLCRDACKIDYSKVQLYEALAANREVLLYNADGSITDNLICQLRQENADKWLFVANIRKAELVHISQRQDIVITVKGIYQPLLYDTQTGEIRSIPYKSEKNNTKIYSTLYDNDSLLLKLVQTVEGAFLEPASEREYEREISVSSKCEFHLEEPNVLVLDMAECSLDGGAFQEEEEILRIDEKLRSQLGYTSRRYKFVQPWAVRELPEDHTVQLRFRILSEIDYEAPMLALEYGEKTAITWNGQKVPNSSCGYYVDKYIRTYRLPLLMAGENVLELTMPYGLRTDLENVYLLGAFGTAYAGRQAYIKAMPTHLFFGSVVHQGMAFYGGNIRYYTKLFLEKAADIELEISYYRGAMVKVLVDGIERGAIMYPPYRLGVEGLEPGMHEVIYILYGNRYNTFSALHTLVADKKDIFKGPDYWRSTGEQWAYEYQTRPMGILKTPIIRIRDRK